MSPTITPIGSQVVYLDVRLPHGTRSGGLHLSAGGIAAWIYTNVHGFLQLVFWEVKKKRNWSFVIQIKPNIKREEFGSPRVACPISLIPSEVGPAEDELGAAGGAGVVMDAGAMLAIATWREKLGLLAAC